MRRFLPLMLSAVVAAGFPLATAAGPVSRLSWDSCSSPLTRVVSPGETSVTIFVTMSGIDVPHNGVDLRFHLSGNDWRTCPPGVAEPPADAWRFDPAGCQGESRASFSLRGGGASKACPWIVPPGASSSGFSDIRMIDDFTRGGLQVMGGHSYRGTPELAPDPNETVFVYSVTFDLSYAAGSELGNGLCGGLGQFMLASNVMNYWVPHVHRCELGSIDYSVLYTPDGRTIPIGADPTFLTIDSGALPVVRRTWGSLKSNYR